MIDRYTGLRRRFHTDTFVGSRIRGYISSGIGWCIGQEVWIFIGVLVCRYIYSLVYIYQQSILCIRIGSHERRLKYRSVGLHAAR